MKNYEAPKIVNISIWAAAIFGVLIFSVSLGLYFFGFLDSQISADTETEAMGKPLGQCKPGETMYTINNYPGTSNLLPGGHAVYYSESDKNWRCSYICIPQGQTLEDYFNSEDFSIDGKRIVIVKSPSMFNDLFKQDPETAMQRTIILDQSRPTSERKCEGPNSVDYGTIENSYNGKIIEKVKRADSDYQTSYGQQLTREEEITGAGTIAGVPKSFKAPVTEGTPSDKTTDTSGDLKQCMAKVNKFLIEYENKQGNNERLIEAYNRIRQNYIWHKFTAVFKTKQKELDDCKLMEVYMEEYSEVAKLDNQELEECISNLKEMADSVTDNTARRSILYQIDQIKQAGDYQRCLVFYNAFQSDIKKQEPTDQSAKSANRDFMLFLKLGYNGKYPSNSDSFVIVYTNNTRTVKKVRCKGAKNQCLVDLHFNKNNYPEIPKSVFVYAVTHGGMLSVERFGGTVVNLNTDPIYVSVDMKFRPSAKVISAGGYTIQYVACPPNLDTL